jgi:nicotinate-nucleotide adenylyltransferase
MSLKSEKKYGVGLFGGTFDPIHIGHLNIAIKLKEKLKLKEMRLILCARPPHRLAPISSVEDRRKMLSLAVSEKKYQDLIIDDIECKRTGLSYTLDTVSEIRNQIGSEVPMYLCLGMDSFLSINTWNHWKDLVSMTHIIVAERPGSELPKSGEVYNFIKKYRSISLQNLRAAPSGNIFLAEMIPMSISSTAIRKAIFEKDYLYKFLPEKVIKYIKENQLYKKI